MSTNPLNGWDRRLAVYSQGASITDAASYAALFRSVISVDSGPAEVGVIRPKLDRGLGRAMQDGWVEGRVLPIPWSVQTSLKSRPDADDAPLELALYKAAGLKVTTNASTNVTLTPSATPIGSGDFVFAELVRLLGSGDSDVAFEKLYGCVVRELSLEGGDKEVQATFGGVAQRKYTGGSLDSITLADGSGTTLTTTAEESYALGAGYYLCESEVILVTPTYGATSHTITRAQLGTSGAAHAAKALKPYIPAGIAYSGAPIPESLTTTVTIDGVALRVTSWKADITTGMDMLDGETGSKYSQGAVEKRTEVLINCSVIAKGDDVRWLNKATARKTVTATLVQGTTAGGIVTLSAPYCEVVAPALTEPDNGPSEIQMQLRVRDNGSGNNSFSLVLS